MGTMTRTDLKVPFAEKDLAKAFGARWDPTSKVWYWPGPQEKLPDGLQRWLPEEPKPSTPAQDKKIVLSIPFEMKGLASEYRARWDSEWKTYVWEGKENQLPGILTPFRAPQFSWEEYAERSLNNTEAPTPLKGSEKITLRPHQEIGVQEAIKSLISGRFPGFLIGDDAGLGKTIYAWEAVCRTQKPGATIVIVCPLSVIAAWRDTILRMGHPGFHIIILNYDRLNRLFQETGPKPKKGSLKGLAKRGEAFEADVFIWDECQRLRNLETARTKFALKLYETDALHLWLSATAGENPLQLGYLLPLLGRTSGIKPQGTTALNRFEDWCKQTGLAVSRGKFGKWNWDGKDNEKDCKTLHSLLFDRVDGFLGAIRRRPEDIAGWPSLQRIPLPIELSDKEQHQYNLEWDIFLRAIKDMPIVQRYAATAGIAALTRFRQKASLLRVEETVDLTTDLLEENHRVAISCQWLGTVKALKEALEKQKVRVVTFTGEDTHREANRVQFQKGEADVIIFTVEEGINLQQGELIQNDQRRAQIDHDIRWSAISMKQIDHRCHRDGKFAKVFWTYAANTKEVEVAQRVLTKLNSMATLSGDDPKFLKDLEGLFLAA